MTTPPSYADLVKNVNQLHDVIETERAKATADREAANQCIEAQALQLRTARGDAEHLLHAIGLVVQEGNATMDSMRLERDHARATAALLRHAYEHDTRPPARALDDAKAWARR